MFVVSEALHCMKQNYHSLVLAAGHYKQTQIGAFVEAGLNVVLSVVLALFMGISGILIATIVSTLYRTIEYVIYLSKNIMNRSVLPYLKRVAVNVLALGVIIPICLIIPFSEPQNYLQWVLKAIPVFAIACAATFVVNLAFYPKDLKRIVSHIIGMFVRRAKK